MRQALFLFVLALLISACGNPHEPGPWIGPGMEVEFFAKWTSPNQVRLSASFFSDTGYDLKIAEGFIRAIVFKGATTNGPWEEVGRRVIGREAFGAHLNFDVELSTPEELTFFRLESLHMNEGIYMDSTSGPVIATSRPYLSSSSWTVLPDLANSTGIAANVMEDLRYIPTALSPDGKEICIYDDRIKIFDASSGVITRSADFNFQTQSHTFKCFWAGTKLAFLGYADFVVLSPEKLTGDADLFAFVPHVRTDTSFAHFSSSSWWYSFSMVDSSTVRLYPTFDAHRCQDDNWRAAALRPSLDAYMAYYHTEGMDDGELWHLYYPATDIARRVTPLSLGGLRYTRNGTNYPYLDDNRIVYRHPTWITNDVVLLHTTWSGRREFWLYNMATESYRQLTNSGSSMYPQFSSNGTFEGIPPMPVPHYDKASNRILFFFLVNENTYAIRAITPPL
jgi:hypothetical protein